MPTFVALLNRAEVGRVQGADPHGLEQMIINGLARLASGSSDTTKAQPQVNHVANEVERQWLEPFARHAERVSARPIEGGEGEILDDERKVKGNPYVS